MLEMIKLVALAYATGSVPSGWILGKVFKGVDIRETGSGSTGTANVFRALGTKLGLATFFIDAFKAWLMMNYGLHSTSDSFTIMLIGIAIILGNSYSCFFLFQKTGKGVASFLGIGLAIQFWPTLICFGIWIVVLAIWRETSIAALVSCPILTAIVVFISDNPFTRLMFLIILCLIVFRHFENIGKIIERLERKFGEKEVQ